MKLTDAVRADIDNAVLCWLATVDAEGVPNVTPKEIFAAHGEAMLVIADIQSAGSVRNIERNPNVCVSFVDVFRQRGFKITGSARIVAPEAADFAALSAELVRLAAPDFQVRNVIAIDIARIQRIRAPSYVFFPERTEDDLMAAAYRTYGVRPV
jgi:predicted pyridoxine 5'-phosphate oxidase superfamily flavin-nucleotide-binding protein